MCVIVYDVNNTVYSEIQYWFSGSKAYGAHRGHNHSLFSNCFSELMLFQQWHMYGPGPDSEAAGPGEGVTSTHSALTASPQLHCLQIENEEVCEWNDITK